MAPSSLARKGLLVMCSLLWSLPLQAGVLDWLWSSGDSPAQVVVTSPFLKWYTGPAGGYPVFHASEKGEWLTLLKQKTRWIKVRDSRGREGWVLQDDLATGSLTADGQVAVAARPQRDDFIKRAGEAVIMMGDFEGAASISVAAGWQFTRNLALEVQGSQVLGSRSEIRLANLSIQHQPFPGWRLAPYLTMGGGYAWISPKATLAQTERRQNPTAHIGLGLRYYLADQYFLRAEIRDYKVFTDRKTNEEVTEWKLGLGIFF
ncbi:SH3 domain-containing protein [Marinobacter sp.]|uniref:SH3 domain-containing protein n=1 Tax=Marinobacter sp. TaxID=50741 RepID=UPI003562583A